MSNPQESTIHHHVALPPTVGRSGAVSIPYDNFYFPIANVLCEFLVFWSRPGLFSQ